MTILNRPLSGTGYRSAARACWVRIRLVHDGFNPARHIPVRFSRSDVVHESHSCSRNDSVFGYLRVVNQRGAVLGEHMNSEAGPVTNEDTFKFIHPIQHSLTEWQLQCVPTQRWVDSLRPGLVWYLAVS